MAEGPEEVSNRGQPRGPPWLSTPMVVGGYQIICIAIAKDSDTGDKTTPMHCGRPQHERWFRLQNELEMLGSACRRGRHQQKYDSRESMTQVNSKISS